MSQHPEIEIEVLPEEEEEEASDDEEFRGAYLQELQHLAQADAACMRLDASLVNEQGEDFMTVLTGIRAALDKHNKVLYKLTLAVQAVLEQRVQVS